MVHPCHWGQPYQKSQRGLNPFSSVNLCYFLPKESVFTAGALSCGVYFPAYVNTRSWPSSWGPGLQVRLSITLELPTEPSRPKDPPMSRHPPPCHGVGFSAGVCEGIANGRSLPLSKLVASLSRFWITVPPLRPPGWAVRESPSAVRQQPLPMRGGGAGVLGLITPFSAAALVGKMAAAASPHARRGRGLPRGR